MTFVIFEDRTENNEISESSVFTEAIKLDSQAFCVYSPDRFDPRATSSNSFFLVLAMNLKGCVSPSYARNFCYLCSGPLRHVISMPLAYVICGRTIEIPIFI